MESSTSYAAPFRRVRFKLNSPHYLDYRDPTHRRRRDDHDDALETPTRLSTDERARLEEFERELAEKEDVSLEDVDQIDAELKYLTSISLRLRARRNACQPISRLPAEMVSEIICFFAAMCPPHRPFVRTFERGVIPEAGRMRSDLGWIKLGHVCRRWREIVLQLPVLWARSVCSLIGAEEVILSRSRAVPLTLTLNAHCHRIDSKTVQFIQQHVQRAREIEIREVLLHPHSPAWPAGAVALTRRDLPVLEILCLDLKPSRSSPITHDVFALPPLNAPRLKRLELTNIFVPWAPAPNLTVLILSRCDFQNLAVVPPPQLLLSLLRNSPHLRKLHLLGWIPDMPVQRLKEHEDDIVDPDDRVVQLPYIEELSLTSSTRRIIAFWMRIQIPPTADVRLRIDPAHLDLALHHPQHDPERYELMRAIGPHFGPAFLPSAPRQIVGVSIFDFPDEESLRFCLFARDPGQENAGQDAQWTGPFARDYSFRLDMQCYRWEMSAPHFVEMLRHVFDSFDFSRIETLELMSHYRGHAIDWQRTLAHVPSPSVLSLDGMPNKELLQALGPAIRGAMRREQSAAQTQDSVQEAPRVLFPGMRVLYLSASAEREWLADEDAQDDVLGMLRFRAENGAPVEHLVLDENALPGIGDQAITLLQELNKAVTRIELKSEKNQPRTNSSAFMPWAEGTFLIPMPPQMMPTLGLPV
ncbi:hypothetical protein K488DRAFT_83152 [Vararia minispora EC-137]|uniref:Uncharacterized protein n=1 Tax=Vararia minispora EC-137 TaxID=1314806 RepID=A0ACB8QUF0_9AGAM|nr:hypothetical protein K488DRAFT_83152 [Vararia minispora EC-137]